MGLWQSLIDEIINAVNTIIYRAIDAIETGLFSIPPRNLGFVGLPSDATKSSAIGRAIPPPAGVDGGNGQKAKDYSEEEAEAAKKEEIDNGVHALETLLEATVDKTFDKFEIYTLRNILTVPDDLAPFMRLAHYEVRCLLFADWCKEAFLAKIPRLVTEPHSATSSHGPDPRIDPGAPEAVAGD